MPFLSPLAAAVALGAVAVNVVDVPERFAPRVAFGARSLLRAGVVLLGFRLSIGDLARPRPPGPRRGVAVVAAMFFGTQWLGPGWALAALGLLVATGYSICGASAMAAMDGVVHADEEETAYAITLVTLCGTLSIFVLPVIAGWTGLAGDVFGTWVGGSVHDVGQDDATGVARQPRCCTRVAMVVKLTQGRAPGAARGRDRDQPAAAKRAAPDPPRRCRPARPTPDPPSSLRRSFHCSCAGSSPRSWCARPVSCRMRALDAAATLEKLVLTAALVGLGMGVRLDRMRRLGGRPLALGLLAWVLVAGFGWVTTTVVH